MTERAYTNDEIAELEGLRASIKAIDDAPVERYRTALAVLRGAPAQGSDRSALREKIARAIHSRRYHMDAKDTDSMFAWYAEKPEGADRSRMAIYSAYQDADAVLATLPAIQQAGTAQSEPVAWIDFADNGNIRFWTGNAARAETEKYLGRHLRGFTLAELVALAAKPSHSGQTHEIKWRHKKRGSIVTEVARGFAQVAVHPIEEMTAVVIYRHDADGIWWVRNAVEFDDGRFEPLETPSHCPGATETEGGR
jgi:hypothetical protein